MISTTDLELLDAFDHDGRVAGSVALLCLLVDEPAGVLDDRLYPLAQHVDVRLRVKRRSEVNIWCSPRNDAVDMDTLTFVDTQGGIGK